MTDPTDNLSPLARRILRLDAERAYEKLTLSATDGNPRALADLSAAGADQLCAGRVVRPDEARAMLAGLWLWQDYLDESHEVCQSIETPSGAWWHAIVHRREGDFSNAKYWYARAAAHPVLAAFAQNAAALLRDHPADKLLLRIGTPGSAGPALVDLVERLTHNPGDALHATAVSLQQLEFRLLFESNAAAAQV